MSSTCLSEATIVRCQALSEIQNGAIFIPVVVQVIFLVALMALYWRSGRRTYIMVVVEGLTFYVVTLLDLLSHLIPEARTNLLFFKSFDIAIGALSFVPILLYTFFLYLFARSYFLSTLTSLTRNIVKYSMLVSIPLTMAMSELGSFFGISYRIFQDSEDNSLLAIDFGASSNRTVWQIFTSVTLVLLIIFQAFVFCFAVYLAISILQERRTGHTYFEGSDMPTLRGLAWVSIGVKLGAVETLLGFIKGGFSLILARRILRMASRGCLALGALQSEGECLSRFPGARRRARTMSEIHAMISNPRVSTFERLSPTATVFYTLTHAGGDSSVEPQPSAGAPIPRLQRVTVQYDGSNAPALALRLSDLHVPPAEVLTETFNRRGTLISSVLPDPSHPSSSMQGARGHGAGDSYLSSTRPMMRSFSAAAPSVTSHGLPRELEPVLRSRNLKAREGFGMLHSQRPNSKFRFSGTQEAQSEAPLAGLWDVPNAYVGSHARLMSASSLASDSLSVVRALAAQFPGIPPRRTASGKRYSYRESRDVQGQPTVLGGVSEDTDLEKAQMGVSPSNSIKRKPPPLVTSDSALGGLPSGASSVPDVPQSRIRVTSEESQSDQSKLSQMTSSSRRRKAISVPPPIDASIAGPDAALAAQVQIGNDSDTTSPVTYPLAYSEIQGRRADSRRYEHDPTSGSSPKTGTSRRTHTPGMTLASGPSPIDTDLPTTRSGETPDVYHESEADDGPRYRVSELSAAESGLGRIAARVAQFDRRRRQIFRGDPRPSPTSYSIFEHESARNRKGKGKEHARTPPPVPEPTRSDQRPISRPRRLSAKSTGSASDFSPRSASSSAGASLRGSWVPHIGSARREYVASTWRASAFPGVLLDTPELMRIKSVGQVTMRQTPTPSTSSFAARQSMRIESGDYSVSDYADSPALEPRASRRPYHEIEGSPSLGTVHGAARGSERK